MTKPVILTPLMKQYFAIKEKYPGALLLFRVGDFYETFLEDAIEASKVLGIVLTKRSNGSAADIALAGFPHHALELYLPKLVKAGHRVAICDQLEDPKQAKGIVQRGVTELVTPGLAFSEAILDRKANHYLAAVFFTKEQIGMAFLDLSTGEFCLTEGNHDYIQTLLQRFMPSEVIFNKKQQNLWDNFVQDTLPTYALEDWIFQFDYTHDLLINHFGTTTLKGFGIAEHTAGIVAAGAILHYLIETEHKNIQHINAIVRLEEDQHVWLDPFTIKALELMVPQQPGGTALIDILDQTVTPMGARLLKKWLLFPLKEITVIQERLDIVAYLVEHPDQEKELEACLKHIGDLERLIAKIAAKRVNPREMVTLRKTLEQIQPIQEILTDTVFLSLTQLSKQFHRCDDLIAMLAKQLQDNPPILTNQGGIIKTQVNEQLDKLNTLINNGKDYLIQLQQKESQRTGIPSLKVAYNRVFGYYLEVSHTHREKVPTDWIRKQTLSNAERYVTEELKYYEEHILQAAEQAQELEQQLYQALVDQAVTFITYLQQNAKNIALLDCYLSFSKQARQHHYTQPVIDHSTLLDLKGNKHPVIEQRLPIGSNYVPNDIRLDPTQQQIMVITGPNMAGKSALLRQVALTVVMAQMGSFVPATAAHIGIVDKIFTRVGASDNLAQGASTFMMEMLETANIMHNLSNRSLVLMDEIGRGTSTYDGVAIAWALVEYLHNHPRYKAKTLFATHYHELNELASTFPNVKNYHVAVQEANGKILFLHKLTPGSSKHSFGIHVAQMAGMPLTILTRATEILQHLSSTGRQIHTTEVVASVSNREVLLQAANNKEWNDLRDFIEKIDINKLSPIEGLCKLNEIKNKLNQI